MFQGSVHTKFCTHCPIIIFGTPSLFFYLSHSECLIHSFNPSVPNASVPNLPPQNIRKPLRFCWCFQGKEKGCIGNEWVNSENTYYLLVQSQQQKYYKKIWNMLKVNNANDVVLVSSLLTLNIFHTFDFYCWLWTSKC